MQREHDERAKLIAEQTLDALGEVRREVEVPSSDSQRLDLWFRRQLFPCPVPGYLSLLDSLFPVDCIIEAFCQSVGLLGFWESIRKQFAWRRHLHQLARAARQPGEPDPLVYPPWMWILSAGHPDALFAEYEIVAKPGFPRGTYDFGKGHRAGLVIIRELPPGKDTLLLRLMGSPAVRGAALDELHRLPSDDPDVPSLRRIVACLRHTLSRATNITQEEREEFMTTAWADFERYEQEIRNEGLRKGHSKGLDEGLRKGHREGLLDAVAGLCEVLSIDLSGERCTYLAGLDLADLEALFAHLKRHRAWPSE